MRLSEVERRAIVTIAREVIGGDVQVRDIDLAERVDAFVARFGRLQDTAADKLLPELLRRWQNRCAAPSRTWTARRSSGSSKRRTAGWRRAACATGWFTSN